MSKGIKRIIREILFRPINILLEPLLVIFYFVYWLFGSDENWEGKSYRYNVLGGSGKEDSLELLWWDL